MSIQFNTDDYNISLISEESRLAHMLTRYRYWVYGLGDDGENAPIRIRAGAAIPQAPLLTLQTLFQASDLDLALKPLKKPRVKFWVHIGLRSDLREFPSLCAATLQTIVYHLEGRLPIDLEQARRCRLPGIPKVRAVKRR